MDWWTDGNRLADQQPGQSDKDPDTDGQRRGGTGGQTEATWPISGPADQTKTLAPTDKDADGFEDADGFVKRHRK